MGECLGGTRDLQTLKVSVLALIHAILLIISWEWGLLPFRGGSVPHVVQNT